MEGPTEAGGPVNQEKVSAPNRRGRRRRRRRKMLDFGISPTKSLKSKQSVKRVIKKSVLRSRLLSIR